jgi:hypothetical protein
MQAVEAIATLITVASILCFLLYVAALLRMPTGHRPTVTPLDRFGTPLPATENPDYHDTEDEGSG